MNRAVKLRTSERSDALRNQHRLELEKVSQQLGVKQTSDWYNVSVKVQITYAKSN